MGFLGNLFGKKQEGNQLRCSVCGKTSEKLMKEFHKKKPDVVIVDTSWVGVCPDCKIAFCVNDATKVPDPVFDDDLVPACPVHKKLLQF